MTRALKFSLMAVLAGLLGQVCFLSGVEALPLAGLWCAGSLYLWSRSPLTLQPGVQPEARWPRGTLLALRSVPLAVAFFVTVFFATGTTFKLGPMQAWPRPTDPYGSLAEGFYHGRLGLMLEPEPALLAMPDPYDPAERGRLEVGLHDAVLYGGRYYLLHGPLPVLALVLPLRVLTGAYLSACGTVVVFNLLGFLFLYLLMARLKDGYFPAASEAWVFAGGLSLALGGVGNYLLTRPWIYEACIASTAAFVAAGTYYYFTALERPILSPGRLALASGLVSAAALGRPNCILAGGMMALLASIFLCLGTAPRSAGRGPRLKVLAALWLPVLSVAFLWAVYNQARFGDPLEFGANYQLAGYRVRGSGFFSLGQVLANSWTNWRSYLLQPYLALGRFPYVAGSQVPVFSAPPDFRAERVVGFFVLSPLGWSLLAMPAALAQLRLQAAVRPWAPLLQILLLMGASALVVMAALFALSGQTHRYGGDFFPALLFLQWATCLSLSRLPLGRGLRTTVAGAYAWSVAHACITATLLAFYGDQGRFEEVTHWIGAALGLR